MRSKLTLSNAEFYGTAQYRFKFTAKNIPSVLLLGLVVPVGLCYLGYQSQVSWR